MIERALDQADGLAGIAINEDDIRFKIRLIQRGDHDGVGLAQGHLRGSALGFRAGLQILGIERIADAAVFDKIRLLADPQNHLRIAAAMILF
ncbi:hypothetical protein SDC9_97577 [bioreactor metagenome]|uniref:Uncharacterized protein n=1 Tax=bioreactor metagenome TaxID=1076179 RepID=A0A645AJ06_9ZZZZ